MVLRKLKEETERLIEERSSIECEMDSIINRLCRQPGGPGLSANLLDSQGFPRPDIDIPAVRSDRKHLAELKNDHKLLTEKITQNIQLLHSPKLGPSSTTTITNSVVATDMDVDTSGGIPFAMIDEISEESPAAEDGLQLGDQVVKFGPVESGDNLISRLASEVQKNQGSAISVVVMRQGVSTTLNVTPRTWQGNGLLGCHFRILR